MGDPQNLCAPALEAREFNLMIVSALEALGDNVLIVLACGVTEGQVDK